MRLSLCRFPRINKLGRSRRRAPGAPQFAPAVQTLEQKTLLSTVTIGFNTDADGNDEIASEP